LNHPKRLLRNGLLASMSFAVLSASSQTLVDDFFAARQFDPDYAAAQAKNQNQRIDISIASAAYYPRANLSVQQLSNESGVRQTFTVRQPLIDVDRWLHLKEVKPREALVELSTLQSDHQLAQNLLSAVRQFVQTREQLRLNDNKAKSIEFQLMSARRALEAGFGTVTDVYDAQLRQSQARAQRFAIQASYENARRSYFSMVGRLPADDHYQLAPHMPLPPLAALDVVTQSALARNPNVLAREWEASITDIGRRRARASLLPSLNASWQKSAFDGRSNTSSGVRLSFELPIELSTVYRTQTAQNNHFAAQEALRSERQRLQNELLTLYNQTLAAQQEVAIRQDAIQAAKLSLQANEKSFEGGVRSQVDVLNAIEALDQSELDYLDARLNLAQNYFKLQLLGSADIESLLVLIQNQLFGATKP
jgi:outer membrane protein TolC